jgi:CheY-like chemotaxis protein
VSVSILVVDDEADVADLFRQSFRREARNGTYVMHFAESGEAALAKLSITGIAGNRCLISASRFSPSIPGMLISDRITISVGLMVTAYGDDERRRRASELGAFEFLTKPVDFDRLKTQLRQLSGAAD